MGAGDQPRAPETRTSPPFLRAPARQAGVHLINDRDDTLYASRSYLTINADGAGERRLRFPRAANLSDAFTGQLPARDVRRFSAHLMTKRHW